MEQNNNKHDFDDYRCFTLTITCNFSSVPVKFVQNVHEIRILAAKLTTR